VARATVPRSRHADWEPSAARRAAEDVLLEQTADRVPELVPIRHGRMLASPYAFFRGAAALMTGDLADTPHSRLEVQLCGDAHPVELRGSAAPDRELRFDIDDFDETARGPWEWAVKRLRRASRSPAASWGWRRPCGVMPAEPEPTDQLAKAKELLDRGAIDQADPSSSSARRSRSLRPTAGAAAELALLRQALDGALRDRLGLRVAAAGTHPMAPTPRSPTRPARATGRSTPRCARWPHRDPRWRATSTSRCPMEPRRCGRSTACAAISPCWSPCPATHGTGAAATPARLAEDADLLDVPPSRHPASVRHVHRVQAGGRPDAPLRRDPRTRVPWWDARLQPRLGTVEVRILDAQSRVTDAAALATVVHCLVPGHAEAERPGAAGPEVLAENRFLAARDGMVDSLGQAMDNWRIGIRRLQPGWSRPDH
jgi:Uncharacterized protein conserved in bacteria (DUF2252)